MLDRTIRRDIIGVLVTEPIQVTATRLISKLRRVEPLKTCNKGITQILNERLNVNLHLKGGFARIEIIKLGLKLLKRARRV